MCIEEGDWTGKEGRKCEEKVKEQTKTLKEWLL